MFLQISYSQISSRLDLFLRLAGFLFRKLYKDIILMIFTIIITIETFKDHQNEYGGIFLSFLNFCRESSL